MLSLEHSVSAVKIAGPPETEAVSVQAPSERPVVDHPPEEDAIEVGSQQQLTNPHSDLIVPKCVFRAVLEIQTSHSVWTESKERGTELSEIQPG